MKDFFASNFPSLLRPERKKFEFEKYFLVLGLVLGFLYFGFEFFIRESSYLLAAYMAVKKLAMLYLGFLIMLELSPDSHQVYLKAVLLMGLVLLPIGETSALSSLYFLLICRFLTKTSGYLTTKGELYFLTVYTFLIYTLSDFIYPLILALVLLLDYKFKHKDHRNLIFIVLNFLLALLWIKNPFGIMTRELDLLGGLGVFLISLLYILRLSILKNILSLNDLGNNLISPRRVKSAGILVIISMIILAIGHGRLYDYIHIWALLFSISFPYLGDIKNLFIKEKEA